MTKTHTLHDISLATGIDIQELEQKLADKGIEFAGSSNPLSPEAIKALSGKTEKSPKLTLSMKGKLSLKPKRETLEKPKIPEDLPKPAQKAQNTEPTKAVEPKPVAKPKPVEPVKPVHKPSPSININPADEDKKEQQNKAAKHKKEEPRKRNRHIVVEYDENNEVAVAESNQRRPRRQKKRSAPSKPTAVTFYDGMTLNELAREIKTPSRILINQCIKLGKMISANQVIDFETAELITAEFDIECTMNEAKELTPQIDDDMYPPAPRAPVVTIMGHVDHGKTTLLDFLRKSTITQGEAGGITQHIGAYQVQTEKGNITFIDTPGHAAFTAMRAHGANVTDIVILVIAADDGIMPQTIEAIEHAKAAEAPILVAVTKMDKPEANIEEIKSQCSQHNLVPEDWGGDTMILPISAKTGDGISSLLDSILLQSEMMELTASAEGVCTGTVLEAKLDKHAGPSATVLIQSGALAIGDITVVGHTYGKVRRMLNDHGKSITSVLPSVPIELYGLQATPEPGDQLITVAHEKLARTITEEKQAQRLRAQLEPTKQQSLEDLFADVKQRDHATLNIIIKTDTQGSLVAIRSSIEKIDFEEINLKIIYGGVGAINLSDVQLAKPNNALLIGFNVRADNQAKKDLEKDQIQVYYFSIIYELIQRIKVAMVGLAGPQYEEDIIGLAEVRNIFKSSKFGSAAGCLVLDGQMQRRAKIRVLRDHKVIFTGELNSLRRFTQDVEEVRKDTECGLGIKDYNDIRVNDQIEAYVEVEKNYDPSDI